MPLMAQLVMEVPLFQEHPAQDTGIHQDPQRPVDGGPADLGQFEAQFFGGEVLVLSGDGVDHGPPW